ncbi:YihY/virulence factor BrkB family protein [Actinobaculum suis]|uniref:YihY/virulence factor BrkB family protein n=1 Tax=Actinobaculum suis TaxID=1657 RepID=UPI000809AC2A|nr:YhjD/YihY/BrkB family envelope integrity protein [Actinobaculum suis]OCA95982.1 hypothetical protein ACU20_02840 [Actinobaculum suis]
MRGWQGIAAKIATLQNWAETLVDRLADTRLWRSLARYAQARGGLLSGGIAYSALFSVSAALTIAWSAFMATLGKNAELRAIVISGINQALPGILKDPNRGGEGLIDPDALVWSGGHGIASIIAAGVIVWTAISIMGGISKSIRAMFAVNQVVQHGVMQMLRSFGGFLILAVGITSGAILAAAAGTLGTRLAALLGYSGALSAFSTKVVVAALAAGVDALIIAFLIRFTGGIRAPRRDLAAGCLLGGVTMAAVKILGTSVVSNVADNPLLAPFAALVTLLLWLNLTARILLLTCAFMANPPQQYQAEESAELRGKQRPNYVTLSAPHTLDWPHDPITGAIQPAARRE